MDACIRRMPDGRSLSCGRLHTMGKAGGEAHGCGEGGNENDTGIMQSGKKYYGAQLVLENITFEVQEGERVAIIGKNGSGKSTVLKLITRQEMPDEGTISIRKNAVTGYLEQMPEYGRGMTVNRYAVWLLKSWMGSGKK